MSDPTDTAPNGDQDRVTDTAAPDPFALAREFSEPMVTVPRRWIDEAVSALDSAITIGKRSCAPGDGLHYSNHERLIREARAWSLSAHYARNVEATDD